MKLLKNYFTLYKPFLVFVLKFLATYSLMSFAYHFYLSQYVMTIDPITQMVAKQSKDFLSLFSPNVYIQNDIKSACVQFFYKKNYILRVIEGCNGLSIIILFVAFIIAFKGQLKNTLRYILFGILIIHVLNIVRIALLAVLLFEYATYEHFWHDILFPLIIYGTVLVLWIFWVKSFSNTIKK
ncbi:Probable transmembrane protein of unknown function [Flavobacterium branchiophilum FL-15]|uniref:Exosortase family protein XrtF n=1 Tax=Flavobacterium branchiophilum (strain FL-15) TaxID=1034807 RepID=G2Z2G5_FLABF|nr:Probable transmembrane protein of unknown function [Flavobacterium branchiophilum FL-15]